MVSVDIQNAYYTDVINFDNILRTRLNLGLVQTSVYRYMMDFMNNSGVLHRLELYPGDFNQVVISVITLQGPYKKSVMARHVPIGKLSKDSRVFERLVKIVQS